MILKAVTRYESQSAVTQNRCKPVHTNEWLLDFCWTFLVQPPVQKPKIRSKFSHTRSFIYLFILALPRCKYWHWKPNGSSKSASICGLLMSGWRDGQLDGWPWCLSSVQWSCCRRYGAMRRLYIGGLSHSITQKDLKDRFGKFGEVEDVELRTKRDDEGEESS